MANAISTIVKYLPKALDTVFAQESATAILESGSKFVDLDFKQAGYVRIADILMDGLSDYYRGNSLTEQRDGYTNYSAAGKHTDGYKIGNVSLKWELYQLSYDRGVQFQIDEVDNEETAGILIGNTATELIRTKVVPEVDAIRFSRIAGKANTTLGNRVEEDIAANTILARFNDAFEWLTEHGVPDDEQVIFVSPAVNTLLQNTSELSKYLIAGEYKTSQNVTFTLMHYNGRPIKVVPSSRFYTNVGISAVNGYYPQSTSKLINFIVCSKKAIVPVVKLDKVKVFGPDVVQDFDGYKVNFRIYHDCIVPKNKVPGIYASISTASATSKANLLSVAFNGLTLEGVYTNPAGMLGTVYYSADTAFTPGSANTATDSLSIGDDIAAGTYYFGLVDGNGQVVAATSGTITVAA